MTRALPVTCLSLAMLVLGAVSAEAKPSIAVLGLEVSSPDNGNVEQTTTAAANALTLALRDRARAGSGPYDTAPGSDKELIDLKLLNDCSGEAVPCMVKIGNDLGAKYILYGHLSKATANSYHVSMTLLNVADKSKGTSKAFDIRVEEFAGGSKGENTLKWARKIYGDLTGDNSGGFVVVRLTGADRGTLLVEENGKFQPKGPITSGTARVTLPEGKYKIAVESEGFQRWETTITVTSGADTSVPAALVPMPKTDVGVGSAAVGSGSDDGHIYGGTVSEPQGEGWHKAFVGSAVTTGVLAVGFGVTYGMLASTGKSKADGAGFFDYGGKCGGTASNSTGPGLCPHGNVIKTSSYVTGFGALAVGGFAVLAYFESHRSSSPSNKEHVSNGHRSHREFAITPVISPTGAGAAMQIDW